ncbi:MAG TPA: WYL domain-containing protein [Leptospiraceae bacterium]|nr:WYL domain-containing protein [Leptospiraceae bacterium]HMX31480.1 WYL domain-containing protein [Leptospiraceae bacterium]HMY33590.1 WYL domain-containing protein [Leptospiraceae bacterium]HMZ62589.1 WYL domain-containing protein [Leptospiraceae bacterium]HNA07962.1 WYL domain-containing protein [Leptospiraceae bacterium]
MLEKNDIQLGISPKPINETEERQLSLLLNLIRNRQGLSFFQIRQIMKEYYSNPNLESDQKKLHRDIDELRENGFAIKFFKINHDSQEINVYRMDDSQRDARIQMTEEELRKFSFLILKKSEDGASNDLFSAAQKIFSRSLQHFPYANKKIKLDEPLEKEEDQAVSDALYKIMSAIKNKTPLRIQYFKTNPSESYYRDIDPLQIIKRNSEDFYLIVYDREKKQKRRFLIPKILKVIEQSGEFLFSGKVTEDDLNYHALNFNIHEKEELIVTCNESDSWKLEKFLFPHPFRKVDNRFYFSTTNRAALFNFILRENDCIQEVNSEIFVNELKQYLSELKNQYLKADSIQI